MRAEERRLVIGREFERPHSGLPRLFRKRIEHRVPIGLVNLQRTMQHVARKKRFFRARSQADRGVREAMPGRRMECESRDRLPPIDLDHFRQSGIDDRLDAILLDLEACPVAGGLILRVGKVSVLSTGKYIPGFREGRYPASPFQPRVPANMIDVEMGEQDVVYILGSDAGRLEPLKEWVIQSIKVRRVRANLPIARPSVDQDRPAAVLNKPAMNT